MQNQFFFFGEICYGDVTCKFKTWMGEIGFRILDFVALFQSPSSVAAVVNHQGA